MERKFDVAPLPEGHSDLVHREPAAGSKLLDEITDLTLQRAARHEEVEKLAAERVARMAASVASSGLWRKMTPERAEVLMMIARARGISEIDALQQFDVIETQQGIRIAMKAEAMLAGMIRAGWKVALEPGTHIADDTRQAYVVAHPAKLPKPEIYELTMENLDERGVSQRWDPDGWDPKIQKKGAWVKKQTYSQHGAAMLRARLISAICRALDPGVILGFYTPEELSDFVDSDPGPSTAEQVEAANRPVAAPATIPDPPKPRERKRKFAATLTDDTPAAHISTASEDSTVTIGTIEKVGDLASGAEEAAEHPFAPAVSTPVEGALVNNDPPQPDVAVASPSPAAIALARVQEAFRAVTDPASFTAAIGMLNKSSREIKVAAQAEMVAARDRISGRSK